ncbi:DUF429 domain-containing protein [Salinicoccus hispanicus]|uniref:DUF429 domain-containing protein n=1 Tax=Salinicoccus hispanicus TaxID=157225 RepID=A0A6N8TZN1_9STAP|nr:DUF429 domain-containing protein [Salinicoccus hispanicus]MXQ50146.1 DUF429 domain-containing protein [Salinicoccus hispanicus]
MKFIGIDLAWTYKNETGICILDESGQVERLDSAVFSNADITEIIMAYQGESLTIAIDAPLIVNNESGGRGAEGALMRARINEHRLFAFNSSRNYLNKTFGDIRGETLMSEIQQALPHIQIGFSRTTTNIVETFPTGICCGLFPDMFPIRYKKKRKMSFEESCDEMDRLIDRFNQIENTGNICGLMMKLDKGSMPYTRRLHKHIEDKIDAFLCAYAMYTIYKEQSQMNVYGNTDDGFILIPVKM